MMNQISVQEAAKWLADGDAVLIDVREPDEFRTEHIVYAHSLPLGKLETFLQEMNIPSARKVIFQCLKGARGGKACEIAQKSGRCANPLYNLDGGITAWKEAGLPLVQTSVGGISIMRQVQIIVGSLIVLMIILGFTGVALGFVLVGFFGAALFFAGLTGWCGLAMLLSKMPWNKK